jgi:ATP-binding cassette subfamily C protein
LVNRPHSLNGLIADFAQFAGARLWALAALMLAGAVVEGFGLLLIVPLAASAMGEQASLPGPLAATLAAFAPSSRFLAALSLFISAMALRSLILFARDSRRGRLQADYQASLQLRSAIKLADKPWAEASRYGQAEIQSLLLNDVPRAAVAMLFVLEVGLSAIMLAVQLGLVALLSPRLALTAVAVLVPTFLALKLLAPRIEGRGKAITADAELSTSAGQRLQLGLKAALAQGTVAQFLAEYRTSLGRLTASSFVFTRDLAAARQISAFGSALAAAFLLFVGARLLSLPFPILLAALVLFARMAAPASSLVQAAQSAIAAAPAFGAIERRLGPLHDAPTTVASRAVPLDWTELALRDATYRHASGGGVEGLSLALHRGEWLGVEGSSAAGKTTLADLMAGLLQPQSGKVVVDRASLEGDALDGWRAGLAYVGQEGLVFDDSVRANLAADRGAVEDGECWAALDMVRLAERVRTFPAGLDHPLGQQGGHLSGGERQRLLIARALLRAPTFIILDEATAALDGDSEAELVDRLRTLPSRPAALVIAHRASTLAHCDSVIAIRHGKLQRGETPR